MFSISETIAVVLALLLPVGLSADSDVQQLQQSAFVTIPLTFTLEAPPKEVWKLLTSVDGFCILTGCKADSADRKKSFEQLGDQAGAQFAGDTGHLVVVYLTPDKEIRIAFEPANGAYLRQIRILIKSEEESITGVEYSDRFTVNQAEINPAAKNLNAELTAGVERFRALIQKKTKK